jgi:hypothetical protein
MHEQYEPKTHGSLKFHQTNALGLKFQDKIN